MELREELKSLLIEHRKMQLMKLNTDNYKLEEDFNEIIADILTCIQEALPEPVDNDFRDEEYIEKVKITYQELGYNKALYDVVMILEASKQ